MANPEQRLRKRCIIYAKAHGWTHIRLHFGAGAARGWPDDLFIHSGGRSCWVEFKGPTGTPKPIQTLRIQTLRKHGFAAICINSFELFKEYLAVS